MWMILVASAALLLGSTAALGQPAAGDELARDSAAARQAMEQGRFADAARLYQSMLDRLPGNPGLLLNLGLAYTSAGRPREGAQALEQAVSTNPDLEAAWLALGLSYQKLGQPEKAIEPFRRYVSKHPENAIARLELADASLATGRLMQALEHFGALAKLQPRNPQAWLGIGRSHAALAERRFETLRSSSPEAPRAKALEALAHAELGQPAQAAALLEEALASDGELPGARAALAAIYAAAGQPQKAREQQRLASSAPAPDCAQSPQACAYLAGDYEAAAGENPSRPEQLYIAALAHDELARTAYRQVERLPESAEAHELRAERLTAQGRLPEAANELRRAVALAPGDLRRQILLGRALRRSQAYEELLPLARRLVERAGGSPEAHLLLGDALLAAGEAAQAIPHLEQALALGEISTELRAALGEAFLKAGLAAQAIPHLEAAKGQHPELHLQLGRAYQAVGKGEEARAALAEYQRLRAQQRPVTGPPE